jgi:hypothetical protein
VRQRDTTGGQLISVIVPNGQTYVIGGVNNLSSWLELR